MYPGLAIGKNQVEALDVGSTHSESVVSDIGARIEFFEPPSVPG